MIKITDYMSKPVITAKPADTIRQIASKMDAANIGSLIIVDGAKPVGIVTERDLIRKAVAKKLDLDKTAVDRIMTKELSTVSTEATLIEIAGIMKKHSMRRIVVVDKKGKLAGIVTSKDLVDILCT